MQKMKCPVCSILFRILMAPSTRVFVEDVDWEAAKGASGRERNGDPSAVVLSTAAGRLRGGKTTSCM